MASPLDFAKALLNRLGLPHSQNRLVGLVAFEAEEGGHYHNGARYNPLNTSLPMPGARSVIGAVKAYTSWQQGVEATARTIVQSNMRPILDALKADASPQVFLKAITATPWCPQSSPGCADYAQRDAYALYKQYANTADPVGGGLATAGGTDWKTIAIVAAVIVAAGGVAYAVKKRRWR